MTDAAADPAELVRRLHQGDATAARALYQLYGSALLRFSVALCACRQTAEDIVHDTFVELLRYPARFDPERGSLSSYLYAIARHRLARVARVARRHTALNEDESANDETSVQDENPLSATALPVAARSFITEDDADRVHTVERIRAAVLDLPLIHREVIALCDLEELPYAEVATVLNCPIGTVRSRLFRARALLGQRLVAAGFADGGSSGPSQPEHGSGEQTPSASTMLACRGSLT